MGHKEHIAVYSTRHLKLQKGFYKIIIIFPTKQSNAFLAYCIHVYSNAIRKHFIQTIIPPFFYIGDFMAICSYDIPVGMVCKGLGAWLCGGIIIYNRSGWKYIHCIENNIYELFIYQENHCLCNWVRFTRNCFSGYNFCNFQNCSTYSPLISRSNINI